VKIRTVVVEDEPVARRRIKRLLAKDTDVEIVAECASGRQAVIKLLEEKPDLVFLDVQMPEMDGFEVLKAISAAQMPEIIFTTAYDNYAIKAFNAHALDYLLKPFESERFERALQRAKNQIRQKQNGGLNNQINSLLNAIQPKTKYLERLFIKSAEEILLVKVSEIDWIEPAGNYLKLFIGKDVHFLRETMSGIQAKLDPKTFLRVARSLIVNIERIKKLHPLFRGEYVIVLESGKQLTTSRSYHGRIQKLFKDSL
jgi:two-component system LytT family response regulator